MSGATATRTTVLTLYKNLLREAQKFGAYNYRYYSWLIFIILASCAFVYRTYAIRRTRDAFRSNKDASGEAAQLAFKDGIKNFEIIKRQVSFFGIIAN